MFALSDFFCFYLGLISNGSYQVTLSKETGCEKKFFLFGPVYHLRFLYTLKSLFPGRFPRILSNWICHQTVFCNWLETEKLTRRKPTNVDECLMEHWKNIGFCGAIIFSSSGMQNVKIFAPATFCFRKIESY